MDIYLINVNVANNIPEKLLQQFNLKNYKDGKVHSLTYLMIDRILREVYKAENREIIFEAKKPILKSKEKYFSVSHSGEYIALAFSDSECGIDIEKIKPRNYLKISEKMGFKSESLDDFYYNWTEYESTYKLGRNYSSVSRYKLDNYILTAVSSNSDEEYELYNSVQ